MRKRSVAGSDGSGLQGKGGIPCENAGERPGGIDLKIVAAVLAILLAMSISFTAAFLVTRDAPGAGSPSAEQALDIREEGTTPGSEAGKAEHPSDERGIPANRPPLEDRLREFEQRKADLVAAAEGDGRAGGSTAEMRQAGGESMLAHRELAGELRLMLIDEYGFDAKLLDSWRDEMEQEFDARSQQIEAEGGTIRSLLINDAGIELADGYIDRMIAYARQQAD